MSAASTNRRRLSNRPRDHRGVRDLNPWRSMVPGATRVSGRQESVSDQLRQRVSLIMARSRLSSPHENSSVSFCALATVTKLSPRHASEYIASAWSDYRLVRSLYHINNRDYRFLRITVFERKTPLRNYVEKIGRRAIERLKKISGLFDRYT